jgi:hypothetical protein
MNLSNLSAEDIAATVEAARRAHEEREYREAEDKKRQQEEEHACQGVVAWKEAEVQKEVEAQKEEAEWREHFAQDKKAWKAVAEKEQQQRKNSTKRGSRVEGALCSRQEGMESSSRERTAAEKEQQQRLAIGLSGQYCLYSVQFINSVKGKEEGDRGGSICVLVGFIFILYLVLTLSVGQGLFPLCDSCMIARIPCLMEMLKNRTWWTSSDWCCQRKMAC